MGRSNGDTNWNFSVNLWDIAFITLGLSIISRETVIPVLVSQLTDSKLAIGLVPALWSLGFYLPQLLTANWAESMPYKKPFVMIISSFCERLPYFLIGFIVLFFAHSAPSVALIAILAGVALSSSGAGLATPAWLDMIAKVIPVRRRGIWFGLGHGLGQLMGVVGAYFVGQILVSRAFPTNYALLFFLAFTVMMISWGGLALTREPISEVTKKAAPLLHYLGRIKRVLKQDANYRRYLISKSMVNLGGMSAGFFAVFGTEMFSLDGRGVGLLTAVLVGTQAVLNPTSGLLADRVGHKTVLATAAFFVVFAPLSALVYGGTGAAGPEGTALASPFVSGKAPIGLLITFVFLGTYLAADHTSSLPIILEFSPPEDRPTYVGLTNTVLAPVLIGAPILGGWLAGAAGYVVMFRVALVVGTVGLILMVFWVREPRRTTPQRVEEDQLVKTAS
ncbi:MAG: MFS transporter [Caldilineaceae bacterium SB0665_bin_25]|nr:MFS transporter [Caldilineaceae bacterium SB0665_bin_25]